MKEVDIEQVGFFSYKAGSPVFLFSHFLQQLAVPTATARVYSDLCNTREQFLKECQQEECCR